MVKNNLNNKEKKARSSKVYKANTIPKWIIHTSTELDSFRDFTLSPEQEGKE
jgi:hypothetical protein